MHGCSLCDLTSRTNRALPLCKKRAGLASFLAKPTRQVRRSVLIFVFDVIPPEQQRNAPKPRKAHNGI